MLEEDSFAVNAMIPKDLTEVQRQQIVFSGIWPGYKGEDVLQAREVRYQLCASRHTQQEHMVRCTSRPT